MHCELVPEPGRAVVRDLDSKNGTLVNGVLIREAVLLGTTVLQIGHAKVRVRLDPVGAMLPISDQERMGLLVGRSTAMRRVFTLLGRAAASDATVLILGEPGTGKGAVAETIPRQSARHDKPLLVLDCGALPRELLESELFGHERGAFTGATAARAGIF